MSSAGRSVDRVLDRLGLLLLALAVLFQAVYCLPEIALASVSVHDGTLHHALALRVLDAARTGENPIDPWVSFSSLGSPVWRSYQPLVHWVMAGAIALGAPVASSGAVVGGLTWLALVLHPVAFFAAARGLGVSRFVAGVENTALSATQFHPEKSGDAGAQLLTNWLRTLD